MLTPTATLAVAVCFSWVVLRSKVPGRSLFDFIAFLPHAVPNILFGVSVLLFSLCYVAGTNMAYVVLLGLVAAHILALHEVGSNNPDGVEIKAKKDAQGRLVNRIVGKPVFTAHGDAYVQDCPMR